MDAKTRTTYPLFMARLLQGDKLDPSAINRWPQPWRGLGLEVIQAIERGQKPWPVLESTIERMNGNREAIRQQIYAAASELFSNSEASPARHTLVQPDTPPLPSHAQLPETLGLDASPWLDRYVDFSRKWSPRAFDGFHEACGLWILSTVAARRVVLRFGGEKYTPLFILLAARTSLYAKSTTAKIAIDTLRAADLDWMLAADASSPQKFIQDLTLRLPTGFDQFPPARQERVRQRLAFAGQRGWFYEEFGQHLHSMNRKDGPMAEFRGIIRRFDDCMDHYEYGTISRGTDYVDLPYLALLGNLTPAGLRPYAKRGAAMWNDGFWARFAFVTPHSAEPGRGRFPIGERSIPGDLWEPLREWHTRLGVPKVSLQNLGDGKVQINAETLAPTACNLGSGVVDAYYDYHDALLDLVHGSRTTDFDGNYARFAEKALRIAMLLASLENSGRLETRHWARGQQVTEQWRAGLHALYEQINEPEPSEAELQEERVLAVIRRNGRQTPAEVARYVRGMNSGEAKHILERLAEEGVLEAQNTARTVYYEYPRTEQ
jgi:hypothetical protein